VLLLLAFDASPETLPRFHVASGDPGAWPRILSALGFLPGAGGVYVVNDLAANVDQWRQRIQEGAVVILEGESALAASLGIRSAPGKPVVVQNVVDSHNPALPIVWARPLALPRFEVPATARVLTRERWTQAPLVAVIGFGEGAVLWLAVHPGARGHERFPYLAQALSDAGVRPPLTSRNLWAFFDWSYRGRADVEYLVRRWRRAGIAALHVAAWHFFEPDAHRDQYLKSLIEACHRHAITVYAWLELPHVSEQFWFDHPEWREKTALGQDAHLDWRRLMNLQNPACVRAVASGVEQLILRFDWDGVNLAELYFESLEGHGNAARFTPMNDDVRREFRAAHGFDPKELFGPRTPGVLELRQFLDWRAGLARRMQEHWLSEIERLRKLKPDLGLVLTHVDDRYDTRMRDLIGADAGMLLPLLNRHDFTFLVEDPATIWNLGPERYTEIAARYRTIAPKPHKLAIDINIVERYQDVYPTKQQTGIELFQLVHEASQAFPRVALYFENSLLPVDLPWLAAAAATAERFERVGGKLAVESRRPLGVPWSGPALVNGRLWPWTDGEVLWLPAGAHAIEPAATEPAVRLIDFNGTVQSAAVVGRTVEIAYQSESPAWAIFDRTPGRLELDGEVYPDVPQRAGNRYVLRLPRGQHLLAASGAN
jgi:hypothetical protein